MLRGVGTSPVWGHCVVFLSRTLNVRMSIRKLLWKPDNILGVTYDGLMSHSRALFPTREKGNDHND